MRIIFLTTLLFISFLSFSINDESDVAGKNTISGYVKDNETGEELIGASVYIRSIKVGTITNVYGFYSLTVPEGKYEVTYSFIGYKDITKTVDLNNNIKLNISLPTTSQQIGEVEIIGEKRNQNIERVEMSTVKIPIKAIKKIPALLGEVDVLKAVMLLPGVLAGVEGSSGFYVRGGNVDQNLILLDDAPVYNASHVAGFFSVFNGDAIKNMKLYKGGIPAEYGGRLSSVLDIRMKDGNTKKYSATGGIGILASRLTIEGPVIKDKSSFIISGRRTYFDLFLPLSNDTMVQKSGLYFYDLNTKVNYTINENNRIFLSGYFGRDVLSMADMMAIDYGNATGTARWNHLFNDKLFMNTTFIFSNYNYHLGFEQELMKMDWKSNIRDYNLKADLTYYLNPKNTIKFGLGSIYHDFDPGVINGQMDAVKFEIIMPNNYAFEHFAFFQNEQKITPLLSVQYGLRLSVFQNIGKAHYYLYDDTDPQNYEVTDTIDQPSGKIYNTFSNLEPRLGIKYTLNEFSSVKASYNRTSQYIHLATNTTSATPLDIWIPSTPNVEPQIADQVALGYFRNFKNNVFETSAEVYYKKMKNSIDFRDHAELLLNDRLEGELRRGDAESYGFELLLRKQEGKLTGWISYTLSRTMRTIPEINDGKPYFAPYDKTNDVSFVLSYDIGKKINASGTWVYSTAPPRTMPTGRFEYGGMIVPVYSDRNSIRIFDYHRLDLSLTYYFRRYNDENKKHKFESSLNASVYNAYSRKNPYSINFSQSDDNPNETIAEMYYLFKAIPSITYNFKF